MRPLRLTHEHQEDREIGRNCNFFLDGEPVDTGMLFVADEWLGYIEEGRKDQAAEVKPPAFKWELDPSTGKPRAYRREGRVEIRLRPEAPEEARQLYEARRQE